jgi:uncharacterized protein (TIGR02186 family)
VSRFASAIALALAACAAPAVAAPPAQTDCLSSGLAEDQVEVKVNYSGARIVLFASSPQTADPETLLVVAIIGPDDKNGTKTTLLQRTPSGPKTFDFVTAPKVFAVGSEPGVIDSVSPEVLAAAGLNAAEAAVPRAADLRDPALPQWRSALVELKMAEKLYSVDYNTIERLNGGLRRARINLPPNAPPGDYRVRAGVFKDGKAICQSERKLVLTRGGLEATLFDLSRKHGLIYGIVAIALGTSVGLLGALVGRR